MARIIVTVDNPVDAKGPPVASGGTVLLDERVSSIHLCDEHAAEQLIERLAWAVGDAEHAEQASAAPAR